MNELLNDKELDLMRGLESPITLKDKERLIAKIDSLMNQLHVYQLESDYQGDNQTWVKELKFSLSQCVSLSVCVCVSVCVSLSVCVSECVCVSLSVCVLFSVSVSGS